jgi:prepilin peptidase CpaA
MILDTIRLLLFPALVIFAATSDLLTMTISNRVSLLLVAGFFVLAALTGMSLNDTLMHVAAGVAVLVVTFGCFAMGWMGGGDAKIAASVALWFGFPFLPGFLLYASLIGGLLTLVMLQLRQFPLPRFLQTQEWLRRLHDKKSGIPYGIALAIGALIIYPQTGWMTP